MESILQVLGAGNISMEVEGFSDGEGAMVMELGVVIKRVSN